MVDSKTPVNELPDYEDYVLEQDLDDGAQNGNTNAAAKPTAYTGVHSTSFKDMLLKPELL
jgi:hypothetical protein